MWVPFSLPSLLVGSGGGAGKAGAWPSQSQQLRTALTHPNSTHWGYGDCGQDTNDSGSLSWFYSIHLVHKPGQLEPWPVLDDSPSIQKILEQLELQHKASRMKLNRD